jgi:hypothetical protein
VRRAARKPPTACWNPTNTMCLRNTLKFDGMLNKRVQRLLFYVPRLHTAANDRLKLMQASQAAGLPWR